VAQTSFQSASKVTTRMDALIGSAVPTSGGTLTLGFGATQADVHVVVMGVRDAGGSVSIGDVATATGSGTIGEISLDGASTSRTIVTVFHAVKEGSQPANGLIELADTAHGSRPSGMATAWSSAAFDPAPVYSWASASAWSGVAMEVMAATVQPE